MIDFLHILASCLGILGFFLALTIWGRCIGFDRYPVQRRAQSEWLYSEWRE